MNRLFVFLVVIFFCHAPGMADSDESSRKNLSREELRPILDTIRPYAITFGEGKKEVHVFVDPMCPLSREYLTWVTSSPKLLKRYRYYVYMYKLKKYDSVDLMKHIYSQEDQFLVLKDVMVNKNDQTIRPEEFVAGLDQKIQNIAQAAKTIDVYKRPYFIVLRKEK